MPIWIKRITSQFFSSIDTIKYLEGYSTVSYRSTD